ncbi:MAG: helix-turn-helix transcriptional regulator [Oscillospiraceae bacterium]|nr:helix-turn-helix transcriptional regulator [Oscillospiraceae bacterium]
MILAFESLKSRDFQLKNIHTYPMRPSERVLKPRKKTGRKVSGFLHVLRGAGEVTFDGGAFRYAPGAVLYLPKGSRYVMTAEEPVEYYRVNFDLYVDGEEAFFSDAPLLMCRTAGRTFAEAVRELADGYAFLRDTVAETALLCTAFGALRRETEQDEARLAPAVGYLLEHLTEKHDCAALAAMCYLSTAQFYKLFHAAYHMAPLQYRSKLLADRAAYLLKTGGASVTEIADLLGFESVAYFSRFFKKQTGISPGRYQKEGS